MSLYSEYKVTVGEFFKDFDFKGTSDKRFLFSTVFGRKEAEVTDSLKEVAKHGPDHVKAVILLGPSCCGKTTFIDRNIKRSTYFERGSLVSYEDSMQIIGKKYGINPYEDPIDEKYEEEIDDLFCDRLLSALVIEEGRAEFSQLLVIEGPFTDCLNRAALLMMLRDMGVKTAIVDVSNPPKEKYDNMVLSRALDETCAKRLISIEEEDEGLGLDRMMYLYRHGLDTYLKRENNSLMRVICDIHDDVDFQKAYAAVKLRLELEASTTKFKIQQELGIDKLGADLYYGVYNNKRPD